VVVGNISISLSGATSALRDAQTRAPQKAPVALPMKTQMIINGLLDLVQNSLCSYCTEHCMTSLSHSKNIMPENNIKNTSQRKAAEGQRIMD